MTKLTIWFWQRMVTPHMAYLAVALAQRGHNVTYVAEEELGVERVALGWELPDLQDVALRFATNAAQATALVKAAPDDTVHLTQGLRSNGNVASAQNAIRTRGQRHFVIMETVDQRGVAGLFRSVLYFWHLHIRRRGLDGILAIGSTTPTWLRRLAPVKLQIYAFAYFLPDHLDLDPATDCSRFRFLFVGAFIPRKRVDLLLQALGSLSGLEFEVELLGDGPLRGELDVLARRLLPGRVKFRGVVPISEISGYMAQADCLVLPSSFDGWGAVASEALMAGTPVICSAACGARGVVQASGSGGVFDAADLAELRLLLEAAVARGKIEPDDRLVLRTWARCLGADAGAEYLAALLTANPAARRVPVPPWERAA